MSWKLGRIVDVYPGEDKMVRVVSVRTSMGTYKRSLTCTYIYIFLLTILFLVYIYSLFIFTIYHINCFRSYYVYFYTCNSMYVFFFFFLNQF